VLGLNDGWLMDEDEASDWENKFFWLKVLLLIGDFKSEGILNGDTTQP